MLLGLKAISKPEHSLSSPKASGSGSGIQDEGNHEDEQKEDKEDTAALATAKEGEKLQRLLVDEDVQPNPTLLNPKHTIIPKGKEKGWPSSVNWADFVRRCKLMVEQKLENMDDLGNLFMFKQVQNTFGGSLQTRLRDKQWQYNSDHLFGAGYYAPQGASIIESTLSQEWQSDSIDFQQTKPLWTNDQVLQLLLVPQIAVWLISEDFPTLDLQQANELRKESYFFGFALHRRTKAAYKLEVTNIA
ncbi:hypothetical protein BT69DRAFT_1304179 [Atractiella rhizophila]|nr:hypothetical protein BT69DRAFT_1304179 [Atractiella rhizophila]